MLSYIIFDINVIIHFMIQLAYVHYTKCDQMKVTRRVPSIKSWDSSLLNQRETIEVKNNSMGTSEILPDLDEVEQNVQREVS